MSLRSLRDLSARAAELRRLLDEIAEIDWRHPVWWLALAATAALEPDGGDERADSARDEERLDTLYLATDGSPRSDTFMARQGRSPVSLAESIASAVARARAALEAVAVLEAQVGNADGSRAFLALLRRAYAAELAQLEANPKADLNRVGEVRRRLNLLGGPPPKAEAPAQPGPAPAPVIASAASLATRVNRSPIAGT